MTTSSIRRQMKNIVNNYSEAEIKVREATSNDPWGPSSSLMTEIADLTYNVVAFSEIMSMVWKRLNDHGKNWRHVYKALTLLDYLIKTGSERVAQQCRENIFAIQTLKDFQYVDRDGKDQGVNVREKAKQLVALLKDEERLKAERAQALKTKERMAQVATGMGSSQLTFGRGSSQPNLSTSYSEQEYGKAGGSPASYHGSTSPRVSSELEQARPQTSGEEELQLQLALAMSREVAEQDVRPAVDGRCRTLMGKMGQTDGPARCSSLLLSYGEDAEERLRRGDDLRLQMALEESRRDTVKFPNKKEHGSHPQQTTLLDLLDALPGAGPAAPKAEPWGPSASASHTNPWGAPAAPGSTSDPWPSFAKAASPPAQNSGTTSPDPFESQPATVASSKPSGTRKTPESFLGPNAALVNLDSLVARPAPPAQSLNPFLAPGAAAASAPVNPFQVNQPQPLTLNQLRGSPVLGSSTSFGPGPAVEPVAVASVTSAASHPALGAGGSSLPPLGPAAVNMVGSLGVPPSAAQATGTTNPFLL
ncbi:epsin-2 isoform X7 [Sagmatias obliquidens]|uniref:epsin-2 isoform X7 n=1 Tax=Sagmatias obliquidens TaxID=3371155 RepID=UPI000F4420C5|nr:epsin-2 isoform X7 [Lagenorhynchus obliquidens]